MSFEDISIRRNIPVINGFLRMPNNNEKGRYTPSIALIKSGFGNLTVYPRLGAGTGAPATAGGRGCQEFVQLPGVGVSAEDENYEVLKSYAL